MDDASGTKFGMDPHGVLFVFVSVLMGCFDGVLVWLCMGCSQISNSDGIRFCQKKSIGKGAGRIGWREGEGRAALWRVFWLLALFLFEYLGGKGFDLGRKKARRARERGSALGMAMFV